MQREKRGDMRGESDQWFSGGMSAIWYKRNEDGSIQYTQTGFDTYAGFFEREGIDIRNIRTVAEHQEAIGLVVKAGKERKSKPKR